MEITRTRAPLAILAALSMLTLGACTRTEEYVLTGAALGAGSGAVIAGAAGGAVAAGAAIGGVAGGVAGYLIAKHAEARQN